MKNTAKFADELRSLFKRLMRESKHHPLTAQEPLHALVRGAMSFDVSDSRAEEAMKLIDKEFVDLNELRVATDLEIQELLGTRYPAIEKRVAMITLALNDIFEREHTLSLDRLKTVSKRENRQFLRDLPDIHPFVEAYVMLVSFAGHAVPLDEEMRLYLAAEEAVPSTMNLEDAQKFVENHLKAEECYDFYVAVRHAAHDAGLSAKKKVKN